MSRKFSILSTDLNPDYLFFVPMTCAYWKEIGYDPYIILVNDGKNKELVEYVKEMGEKYGAIINDFEHMPGYRTCNVSQISRLYAAADPFFKDDDYLITDDMDKFVIDYMWFNQQDHGKDIHIFDPDELNYTRLKIGNIGMNASVWREVIGFDQTGIRQNLQKCFDKNLSKESDWETGWNLDEWILTKSVFKSDYYPARCQMLERGGNQYGIRNGRIDRGAWAQTMQYCMSTKTIDVHLHRKPYEEEIWEDVLKISSTVFPSSVIEDFRKYREKFLELM